MSVSKVPSCSDDDDEFSFLPTCLDIYASYHSCMAPKINAKYLNHHSTCGSAADEMVIGHTIPHYGGNLHLLSWRQSSSLTATIPWGRVASKDRALRSGLEHQVVWRLPSKPFSAPTRRYASSATSTQTCHPNLREVPSFSGPQTRRQVAVRFVANARKWASCSRNTEPRFNKFLHEVILNL